VRQWAGAVRIVRVALITGAGLDPSCAPAGIPSNGSDGEGCWGEETAGANAVVGVDVGRVVAVPVGGAAVVWFVEPGAAAQQLGDPPSSITLGRNRDKARAEAVRRKEPAAQPNGVALGQVRIPAQGGGADPGRAETAVPEPLGATAQAAADAQQAVVAQADAPADQVKAHEAGAHRRAVQVRFAGMQPQSQVGQLLPQHHEGLSQRLRMIGEQSQIIYIAQLGLHAGEFP
jgi:hypothetical protein